MSANNEDLKKVTQRRRPHGPGARMMPGEKAKDFEGSIGKLVRFMGQFKAALVLAIIFAIGSAAFNIVGPKVLSQATTELFEGLVAKVGGTGGIDFDAIAGIIAATLVLYLVSAACSFVQGWMMTSVSQRTCYGLRRAIAEKIDRMPVGYFERNSTGDTLSRITNDVDTLGQSLNQGVTQLITSATTIVGVVIMMLTINPLLTGITVLILPVSLALIFTVVKASQKHFRAQQAMLGAINGQVEETFSVNCPILQSDHCSRSKHLHFYTHNGNYRLLTRHIRQLRHTRHQIRFLVLLFSIAHLRGLSNFPSPPILRHPFPNDVPASSIPRQWANEILPELLLLRLLKLLHTNTGNRNVSGNPGRP